MKVPRWLSGPEVIVSMLALLLGGGVYLYAHKDEDRLAETKERGSEIVAALERHRRETGDYPPALEALVTEYLPSIEQPTWGLQRWRYQRYTRERAGGATDSASGDSLLFMLSVAADEAGYPLLFYDITARRWVLNN